MLIKPNSPFYKNPTLWLIVLLPATTVIVGIIFVVFSVTHYDGVVDDDYYKKGKQINQTLERDEVASQYGLSAVIQLISEKKLLTLELNSEQYFEFPEQLEIKFIHRTVSDQDIAVNVVQDNADDYFAVLPELPEGLWLVELSTPQWRLRSKITYPEQNQFLLSSKGVE